MLLSVFPRGEGLKLDLAIHAGGDAAQTDLSVQSFASSTCAAADRRQAPLGPDSPLFGTRIPPGTSTQSPNTSISTSTLFDTFDGARRLLEARHGLPEASTQSTPSPTIPGDFDRDEEDEIDQELQDDFDEEPIPSTAEEHTSSPELLGLTTSDYDFSTPDLFERSSSSPEPEDPIPATLNLVLPTPSSFRAHAQPPIASSSRLSNIPSSDLAPPPPLAPSNAASNSNPAPPAPAIPSTTTTSSSSPTPTTTTNMSQNTTAPLMPPRGHSTAPSFDPSEVRSLRRYFQDLEALFTRCQITDEAAKKQWAVRYPSIDVADLWETIESFIDVAKSYNDWKADVRALYPGADDTRKWSLADMDQLIGERARIGIHNAADLGCYYRDFMAITKHLIAQHRLSTIEQSRAFLRGFQPALLTRLETRLHLKHPDHYADDPPSLVRIPSIQLDNRDIVRRSTNASIRPLRGGSP
ncbi:predicted protein [Postia placenta Mad-698-R]|nr:predicted protein [Postia placenta Mad-698-R]